MNYKVYLYAIFVFLSIYMLSGINFEKFIKKNKILETKILILFLSIAFSYLITNFIIDFLNI